MKVTVLYFAVVRERLGRGEERIDLPPNATGTDLLDRISSLYPSLGSLLPSLSLAINEEVAPLTETLRDGDTVALLPPVAGGSARLVRLQAEPISIDEAARAVSGPEQGGLVLFCGTVRGVTHGRRTVRLEYEAYGPMASRSLHAIVEDVERKHGARLAILHRTGTLVPGETAVVVAASAPHRPEAFAACREAIDRLKRETPIWKKEVSEDGAFWVEGCS